jgi:hypothetical protein
MVLKHIILPKCQVFFHKYIDVILDSILDNVIIDTIVDFKKNFIV